MPPPADLPPRETIDAEIRRPTHDHFNFNISHRATSLKAEFYPAGQDTLHAWAMNHRVTISVSDEQVELAPPEYGVIRKLEYFRAGGSDHHLRDIRSMFLVDPDRIDTSFIVAQVNRPGLHAEWHVLRSTLVE